MDQTSPFDLPAKINFPSPLLVAPPPLAPPRSPEIRLICVQLPCGTLVSIRTFTLCTFDSIQGQEKLEMSNAIATTATANSQRPPRCSRQTPQVPFPTAQVPVPTAQVPVPSAQVPVPSAQVPVPSAQVPVPSAQEPLNLSTLPPHAFFTTLDDATTCEIPPRKMQLSLEHQPLERRPPRPTSLK